MIARQYSLREIARDQASVPLGLSYWRLFYFFHWFYLDYVYYLYLSYRVSESNTVPKYTECLPGGDNQPETLIQ